MSKRLNILLMVLFFYNSANCSENYSPIKNKFFKAGQKIYLKNSSCDIPHITFRMKNGKHITYYFGVYPHSNNTIDLSEIPTDKFFNTLVIYTRGRSYEAAIEFDKYYEFNGYSLIQYNSDTFKDKMLESTT